jgi:hypothetical protein
VVNVSVVGVSLATLAMDNVFSLISQVKLTPTVAVTVQVLIEDVSPTLDELVHGAVADQVGCTTRFLRTHRLANESQLNHELPTRGSERL